MQLIIVSLALFVLLSSQQLKAQIRNAVGKDNLKTTGSDSVQTEMATYHDPNWDKTEIDILSSYYEQDGNNAAVTGGTGTETLTDFTQKIILAMPLNQKLKLNVDGGYDYYTSDSSDNVDPIRSDDSAADLRVHANVGITKRLDPQQSVSFRLGGSGEYDYGSGQIGMSYLRTSKRENTIVSAQFQAFIDQWKLIYPVELRGEGVQLHRKDRQSVNLGLGLTQVLDKKTQIAFQLEGVYMNGLLSTPFHRVYFQEQTQAGLERLPDTRLKIPVGVQLNRYINQWLIARASYRFYWDDWGVQAHTASLELPIKLNRFLAVIPFYRYHQQTAAQYFKPYKQHSIQSTFRTSDHDLAALTSQSFGAGISYAPAQGLASWEISKLKQGKHLKLKNIDLKYAHYSRSTGLRSNIVSLGMGFSIH